MTTSQIRRPDLVQMDPDVLGGMVTVAGTRVPLKTLFDYLASGQSLDDFLSDFPTVDRSKAIEILKVAGDQLAHLVA